MPSVMFQGRSQMERDIRRSKEAVDKARRAGLRSFRNAGYQAAERGDVRATAATGEEREQWLDGYDKFVSTAAWKLQKARDEAERQAFYDRYTPTERKLEDALGKIIGEDAAGLVRELVEALIAESRRDHSDD